MRTIVVTGSSSGLGLAAARQLAAAGDQVVVVGRDPARLGAAMAEIRRAATGPEPDELRADFESFTDVRRVADHVLHAYGKIDVLANNAGGLPPTYRTTADGLEATVQSGHLGPFLLTSLLRERLRDGRVIWTSSEAHRRRSGDPTDFVMGAKGWSSWPVYGTVKAQNIMTAQEATRRWPDILSVSFHPGVVRTRFASGTSSRLLFKLSRTTPQTAGARLVRLATAPADELEPGGYYNDDKLATPDHSVTDPTLQALVWDRSEQAAGL
jgi:NAD(P)-dependent dehydrogenase (short-subunit alcohol dehydrogenase family)